MIRLLIAAVFALGLGLNAAASAEDLLLGDLLIAGQDWELVAKDFTFTEGPAVDAKGNLYFTDVFRAKIHRLNAEGKPEVFVEKSGGSNGLMFGPDGRLYACQNGNKQIVAYDADGKETVIAKDVKSNDLVVTRTGAIYFTDPENNNVWYIPPGGEKRVVEHDKSLGYTNGLILWPDQQTLVVVDMKGFNLWAYRTESDGSLKFKQPFYTLQTPPGKLECGADGMTIDDKGRVYAATQLGLQVFDVQGRLSGIISKPPLSGWLANAVFAGPQLDTLYVTATNKVFKRKINAKGFRYFDATAAK